MTCRIVVWILLAGVCQSACGAAPHARPRHLLFVVTDDQRWDTIASLGNREIHTPHLDTLVQRGFVFSNAYCMGSMVPAVCIPSRTMLLSGKSLWRMPDPRATQYSGPTLGKTFRQAGFATFFCGKQGNGFNAGNRDFETVIFDESRPGGRTAPRAQSSEFMADSTLSWLSSLSHERPFCIYLGPPVPHDPREAPPEFMRRYDPNRISLPRNFLPRHPFDNGELMIRDEVLASHPRTPEQMRQHLAEYYACITCFDHHLGRIIAAIRDRGQLDETLIVFTSDQGLAVGGMHGLMGKQNLYEHNKPPLIIAGPGIPSGQRSDALVYLFDLFPTVCQAFALPAPQTIDGVSLLPIIRREKAGVRETLFGAYRESQRMLRDPRWKLIRYHAGGTRNTQLFDLAHDPDELQNLAEDPRRQQERIRLESLLSAARRGFGDPIPFDQD